MCASKPPSKLSVGARCCSSSAFTASAEFRGVGGLVSLVTAGAQLHPSPLVVEMIGHQEVVQNNISSLCSQQQCDMETWRELQQARNSAGDLRHEVVKQKVC